jgi:hypothetical protein
MPLPLLIIGVPVGLAALGFFVDKTGEGVESASNGVIKLAAAGAIGFVVLKKAKVI